MSHKSSVISRQSGFTLVETLVAASIFVVVLTIASGYFTSAIVSQRQVLAVRPTVDEVSFLAEYLSRALRPARKALDTTCISPAVAYYEVTRGGAGVKFIDSDDRCREIYAEGGILKETINGGAAGNLTSTGIEVTQAAFVALDSGGGIIRHPRISGALTIRAKSSSGVSLHWQTSVSQRDFREL